MINYKERAMKLKLIGTITRKIYLMITSMFILSCIFFFFALYSSNIMDLTGTIARCERECIVTYYQAILNFNKAIIEHNDTYHQNFKKYSQAAIQKGYTFSTILKDVEKYPYDEIAQKLDQAYTACDYKRALNTVKMVGLFSSNAILQQLIDVTEQAFRSIKKLFSLCTDYNNSKDQAFKKKLYSKIGLCINESDKLIENFTNKNIELANWIYNIVKKMMIIVVLLYMACVIICCRLIHKGITKSLDIARNNIQESSLSLQLNSEQQRKAVITQTMAVTEISSVMQELVNISKQVADISNNAINISINTNQAVEQSQVVLQTAIVGMDNIKEKVEISADNMIALGKKSQQIEIVLDVINELSQQVTVLSYNATIEAAGAGEKNKRFMAVADRIVKLAEQSVQSSKEIKSIIDNVQTDSNKTIMSTEDEIKAVKEGILLNHEVVQSLAEINNFTKQVQTSVNEINISLNQQTTGVKQTALEIEKITVLLEETNNATGKVTETAKHLFQMAEELKKV